jgi:hypothetical protein
MSQRNSRQAKARRRAERARQRARLDATAPGLGDFVFGPGLEIRTGPDDQCMWAEGCEADWQVEIDCPGDIATRLCEPHARRFVEINEPGWVVGTTLRMTYRPE